MRNEITTKRLVLRELTLDDATAFSALAGDYDVAKMTGTIPHPFPLHSAEFKIMYLRRQRQRGLAFPYAITRESRELIGVMDLFRSTVDATLEIGYWIGKPHWGQGLASEAAQTIIKEARETLGITALKAGAYADNPASHRVLEKLGFRRYGEAEPYFSMARLKSVPSVNFKYDVQMTDKHVSHSKTSKLTELA